MLGLRLTNIRNHIDRVLFPEVCFGCNARLSGGENLVCTACRNDLPLTDFSYQQENSIDRIFYGRVAIEKANSLLFFRQNGIVKNILHYLKYRNQEQIGAFFGDWFGQNMKDEGLMDKIDIVMPVPLHHKKLKLRGYNQVDLFGKKIAYHLNARFIADALVKTANTKTQTKKARVLRWSQIQQLYTNNPTYNLKGKIILLVDDVITTGATIEACAKALQNTECTKIFVASMAVVPKLGN